MERKGKGNRMEKGIGMGRGMEGNRRGTGGRGGERAYTPFSEGKWTGLEGKSGRGERGDKKGGGKWIGRESEYKGKKEQKR